MATDTKIPRNKRPESCRTCGETGDKFGLRGNGHGHWYYYLDCWNCRYRQQRDRQNANRRKLLLEDPERYKRTRRARELKRYYKITLEHYEAMIELQGGGCAICGRMKELKEMPVDHCHEQGHIRGVLCNQCNRALGLFRDSPEILRTAADYIESWRK